MELNYGLEKILGVGLELEFNPKKVTPLISAECGV